MKKIILLAAFGAAGLINAKHVDLKKDNNKEKIEKKSDDVKDLKSESKAEVRCLPVGMYVWCTGEMVADTMCWGPGTGASTYQQATACQIHNSQLLTEYFCGEGTGSSPYGW